jgi:hypothetical protein
LLIETAVRDHLIAAIIDPPITARDSGNDTPPSYEQMLAIYGRRFERVARIIYSEPEKAGAHRICRV